MNRGVGRPAVGSCGRRAARADARADFGASGGDIWTKKKGPGYASEEVADRVWDGQFA